MFAICAGAMLSPGFYRADRFRREGIAKLASAFLLAVFGALNIVVMVMRESRVPDYRPRFRSPLYPWTQLAGVAVSVGLIAVSGLEAVLAIAGVGVAAGGWYVASGRRRVDRGAAVHRLADRRLD